jgi:CubicO group peptidase (beta-lactamase class C family)
MEAIIREKRRMKRLLFVFVYVLLTLPSMAWAQDEDTFSDPNGLYTVPVPTNWTAQALDGYALLNDPDELINTYIVTVEGLPTDEAIAAAWEMVDPDFALEAADTISPPPPPNVDELIVVTYDTGSEPRVVQAVGQRVGEIVYVIMLDGELNAVVQRNAQAQTIFTGFQIVGQEQTDLSAVDPLPIDEAILAELEAYTADLLVRLEVPGAAVAIVQDGEVVYTGAFGVKALGSDDLITPETQFMIGSTTKPITTTMMATLVDDGIIAWDEPVVDVLPQFAVSDPELTQQFTLRNLVCACTGVPRRDLELLFNADDLTASDIVASLQTFQFFTDFGETFQYSNQLVATGGYAAAAALDPDGELYATYLEAMQTRIFDPLAMTNTTFDFDAVVARGDYALPHAANLDGVYYPLSVNDVSRRMANNSSLRKTCSKHGSLRSLSARTQAMDSVGLSMSIRAHPYTIMAATRSASHPTSPSCPTQALASSSSATGKPPTSLMKAFVLACWNLSINSPPKAKNRSRFS